MFILFQTIFVCNFWLHTHLQQSYPSMHPNLFLLLQDKELLRMEVVDEQLSAVGKAFMGLTMDCARCHDHPFDPIPIHDYYSIAGIFRSTNSLVPGNVAGFHERNLRDEFGEQRKHYEQTLASLEKRLKDAVNSVKSLGGNESNNNSIDKVAACLLLY